ncbi:MAG TPA: hypothetical protein VFK30_06830 [Anaerolineae bacterium]|nr:hypothetical protein [Anaerolineae bacterium]
MADKTMQAIIRAGSESTGPASYLRQEYQMQRALFQAQPALVQRFLESQARQLGEAIANKLPQVRFSLPDRVVLKPEPGTHPVALPNESREELAGGLIDRLTRTDLGSIVRQRLTELEQSSNKAVAVSASLIRYVTAYHMVHGMLPSGRTIEYKTADGEEIPTIPVGNVFEPASATTASTDAIVEGDNTNSDVLLVPYVPAARRFYLPQWVAFDDDGRLLVNSPNEAEGHVGSMQRFLTVLHAAVALAPYMVADEDYQQKRYGMLGQLINQGRALAKYETNEIVHTIQRRAKSNDLNRGLSLSLPYFDDQSLLLAMHNFEVIPAGRIMFVPAFVVRAAREEQAKVAQDTRLSLSTRKYLLAELKQLEQAFDTVHK